MKTIIVGDSHGLIEEVVELVEQKCGFKAGTDVLMSVGDMVDKGPESAAVVRFFRELGATVVLGNHEAKHVKYRKHFLALSKDPSYKIPMKWGEDYARVFSSLSEKDLDWVCGLPKFHYFGGGAWILVHAGLQAGLPMEKQAKCLWLRYVRETDGEMIPFDGKPGAPVGGVWWASRWQGPEKIVYGHQPWDGEVRVENGTYGIDTGAVHGKKLTALVFEGVITADAKPEIVQVASKKVYAPDIMDE